MMTVALLIAELVKMPEDAHVTISEKPLDDTLEEGMFRETKNYETLSVELVSSLDDGGPFVFITLMALPPTGPRL